VVLVYELWQDGQRIQLGLLPFIPSKHLELPDPEIIVTLGEDNQIQIEAKQTARFVMIEVPDTDVRFSDNFFDIPAGRTVTVSVLDDKGFSIEEILDRLTITSLKDSY
jgi:beta-mannosidase